jgi:hypothetical protein
MYHWIYQSLWMPGLVKKVNLLLPLHLLLIFSCSVENKYKTTSDTEAVGYSVVEFPEVLHEYLPGSGTCTVKSSDLFSEENRFVLAHMTVSCITCLGELDSWHEKVEKFHSQNVPVYFILRSYDDFSLFTFLFEVEKNTLPAARFFFDIHNEFEALNPAISDIGGVKLFFLDQNASILAEGDPIRNPKFLENYFLIP